MSIRPHIGWVIAVTLSLLAWSVLRSPFRLKGGRGGTVYYRKAGFRAELAWEMLLGDTDMTVIGDLSRWTAPRPRAMTWSEVLDLSRALAADMHINIEVTHGDNREVIHARRKWFFRNGIG
jgi:hypothetical protein